LSSRFAAFLFSKCGAMQASSQPVELGTVHWKTAAEFKDALKESKESGKPIFLLFQEIPG